MTTLNLIPPYKKRELHLMQVYIGIKNLIIFVLLALITIAVLLLVTKIILQNHFNTVVEETTLITRYANTFNKDIVAFNRQVDALEKVQSEHINWTLYLTRLGSIVPTDVTLNHVEVKGNKVLINGFAKDRNSLLTFKNQLSETPIFSNVNLPLEYQLKREDIEFSIKADVDIKSLKPYVD